MSYVLDDDRVLRDRRAVSWRGSPAHEGGAVLRSCRDRRRGIGDSSECQRARRIGRLAVTERVLGDDSEGVGSGAAQPIDRAGAVCRAGIASLTTRISSGRVAGDRRTVGGRGHPINRCRCCGFSVSVDVRRRRRNSCWHSFVLSVGVVAAGATVVDSADLEGVAVSVLEPIDVDWACRAGGCLAGADVPADHVLPPGLERKVCCHDLVGGDRTAVRSGRCEADRDRAVPRCCNHGRWRRRRPGECHRVRCDRSAAATDLVDRSDREGVGIALRQVRDDHGS